MMSRAATVVLLLILALSVVVNAQTPPFSYDEGSLVGPSNWPFLVFNDNETENQCGGESQSPIDIATIPGVCDVAKDFIFTGGTCSWKKVNFRVTPLGPKASTPRKDFKCDHDSMQIPGLEGETYDLSEINIRLSSEHTFNGKSYPAEMQILHQQRDGEKVAIIAIPIDAIIQEDHPYFERMLDFWVADVDKRAGNCDMPCLLQGQGMTEEMTEDELNFSQKDIFGAYNIIPPQTSYYVYDGSLSAPPCTESIIWAVSEKPIQISTGQFHRMSVMTLNGVDKKSCVTSTNAYVSPIGTTARPVQPLNGREVQRFCPALLPKDTIGTFAYDGEKGPQNWGMLDIEGNECGGWKQSPVALESPSPSGDDANISKRYTTGDYKFTPGTCTMNDVVFEKNNHSVEIEFKNCENPRLEIPGVDGYFIAVQFHIHANSEHSIDGRHYPAELHIVHEHMGGELEAVVGTMITFDGTEIDEYFDELLSRWSDVYDEVETSCSEGNGGFQICGLDGVFTPGTSTNVGSRRVLDNHRQSQNRRSARRETQSSDILLNPYSFISQESGFFSYFGSVTTPPCKEVVYWTLSHEPLRLPIGQYTELVNLILQYRDPASCEDASAASVAGSTSRPPQPLYGRVVTFVNSS